MAAKLTRARATREVAESARRLSDRLWAKELRCFGLVDAKFARTPRAQASTVAAFRSDSDERTRIVHAHRDALLACAEPVTELVLYAAEQAERAIGLELRLLERSMPKADQGTTKLAMEAFDTSTIVEVRMKEWSVRVWPLVQRFSEGQTAQIGQAESVADLNRRLFSDQLRPRGIWWKTPGQVKEQARAVAISVANTVRLQAMDVWNQVADG